MPTYFRQSMGSSGALTTPIETLLGQRIMRNVPAMTVMRGQDHVPAQSRRIIARSDAHGASRDIRARVTLTPGCFPVISYMPIASPLSGSAITGTIVFRPRSGSVDTQSVSMPLPVGVVGASLGANWFATSGPLSGMILPDDVVPTDELTRWSQSVVCEIDITVSDNVTDCVIYEMPWQVALASDSPSDRWTSHIITAGSLDQPVPKIDYPLEQLDSVDDPRGGAHQLIDVADAQATRLGPVLVSWQGSVLATGSLEALHNSSVTRWTDGSEGLSAACGGYARRWRDCSPFVLDGRVAAIPVRLWSYSIVDGAGGVVRVQTAPHSWVETEHTVTGWQSRQGWLEVGLNADDRTLAQVYGRNDGTSFRVEAAIVEYHSDAEAPAA